MLIFASEYLSKNDVWETFNRIQFCRVLRCLWSFPRTYNSFAISIICNFVWVLHYCGQQYSSKALEKNVCAHLWLIVGSSCFSFQEIIIYFLVWQSKFPLILAYFTDKSFLPQHHPPPPPPPFFSAVPRRFPWFNLNPALQDEFNSNSVVVNVDIPATWSRKRKISSRANSRVYLLCNSCNSFWNSVHFLVYRLGNFSVCPTVSYDS